MTFDDDKNVIVLENINCRLSFIVSDSMRFLDCPAARQQCMSYIESSDAADETFRGKDRNKEPTTRELFAFASTYFGVKAAAQDKTVIEPFLYKPYCECLRYLPPLNSIGEDFYNNDPSSSSYGALCSLYNQVLVAVGTGLVIYLWMQYVAYGGVTEKEEEEEDKRKLNYICTSCHEQNHAEEKENDEPSRLDKMFGTKGLKGRPMKLAVLLFFYGIIILILTVYSSNVRCIESDTFELSATITNLMAYTVLFPPLAYLACLGILLIRTKFMKTTDQYKTSMIY